MRIWGLTASTMHQLSRIGVMPNAPRNNIVTVTAGDSGGNMSLAFAGAITDAWPDFSNVPEASLNVTAFTGLLAQMKPIAAGALTGIFPAAAPDHAAGVDAAGNIREPR
jgi:hypothetical protein